MPVSEPVSDPVAALGGAVVPGQRQAPQFQLALATYAATGLPSAAQGQKLRRALRALLNNGDLKFQGFLYVVYSDDTEQDGWYAPDATALAGIDKTSWKAVGLWQTPAANWLLIGRQRTHREARKVWMKQLNLSVPTYERDYLGWIVSTDFSALPALALTVLPNGATQAVSTVTRQAISGAPLPAGRDGGVCQLVQGLTDQTVVSYERPEAALNLSDVIVYDRRGQLTHPSTGPDTSWEEVYGPDYPWNWGTAGQAADTPVLDNGLIRVRFDATAGDPGFSVDVWNGASYVEQGKVTITRIGDSTGYCDTWVSAGLAEYTPDRAVMRCVLERAADAYSREIVYVTVQRGERGATFEVYPAVKSNTSQADAQITYTMNGPDSNDSIMFEPSTAQPPTSATDQIWGTASSNWMSAAGTFSGSTENYVSVLRCIGGGTTVGPYQVNLAVVQQGTQFAGASDSSAYGSPENAVQIQSSGGLGYVQVQVSFAATQSDQVQGSTSSWAAAQASQYRVFGLSGSTWTDYGEYTGSAVSTGTSSRVEVYLTQDRTRNGALYGGARDAGQAALYSGYTLGAVVAR